MSWTELYFKIRILAPVVTIGLAAVAFAGLWAWEVVASRRRRRREGR